MTRRVPVLGVAPSAGVQVAALSAVTPDIGGVADDLAFRLLSIRPARAPTGNVGRDWLEYCIGQGQNVIKGYRRGDLQTVGVDVAKIVTALNERRRSFKTPTGPKRGRPAAAASKPAPREDD
jgi:hypothetical protein